MTYEITVYIGRKRNESFIVKEIDSKRIEELIANGFSVRISKYT